MAAVVQSRQRTRMAPRSPLNMPSMSTPGSTWVSVGVPRASVSRRTISSSAWIERSPGAAVAKQRRSAGRAFSTARTIAASAAVGAGSPQSSHIVNAKSLSSPPSIDTRHSPRVG